MNRPMSRPINRCSTPYPQGRVTLREVGLRDGLQLVKQWPDTPSKKAWMAAEYNAGVRHFEIGSFLPASRFPQFADIEPLITAVGGLSGSHCAALTLNERGVANAMATSVDEIVCVVSATEDHSQANMRRSRADAITLVRDAAAERDRVAPDKLVNVGIAMAFGCTIAGAVNPAEVLDLAEQAYAAGADIVGLADTIGYAGPNQIADLCQGMQRLCAGNPFIIHLHDTRGMGVANAAAALDNGVSVIDASLGGLGGCPFAPGATGNVVFEDIVFLCERMGFATGIDIPSLAAARAIAEAAMPGEMFYGNVPRAGVPQNITWAA